MARFTSVFLGVGIGLVSYALFGVSVRGLAFIVGASLVFWLWVQECRRG